MKLEFKLEKVNHKESFEVLEDMLALMNRQSILNDNICAVMDQDESTLPEVIDISYIDNDYTVIFMYIKKTGKITLTSRKVQ